MSQPYLGEIRMFAGNFAPRGNALCQGQILNIAQNTALFSLLGTFYGGNGQTTFGLPDLRGRLPLCMGQGNGLSNYNIGQQGGTESVTLANNQMPLHNHMMLANSANASLPTPAGNMPSSLMAPIAGFWVAPANITGSPIPLNPNALNQAGGSQPHENRMPILAINYIVALQGIFPSRS
jgi:microcystin-dependent protein